MPEHLSIFEEQWWYEAATNGKWQQVSYSDGQNLNANLIFVANRRRGSTVIGMPATARVMQPIISFISNKPKEHISDSVKALRGLSDLLPEFDRFEYTLPPESKLDIAFHLSGYTVTANYTFRADPSSDHDPWAALERKVRYKIKTGSTRLRVEVHSDIMRYINMSGQFIRERAFGSNYDYEAILRIWDACDTRNRAAILSCVDGSGHDIASAILIWDDRHLYYWLSCRNPAFNDSAANSVLIWNAIEFAGRAGLVFDMDGYATPDAGLFLSRFGLLPQRRFDISMVSSAAGLRAAFSAHFIQMVGPKLRKRLLIARNLIYPRKRYLTQAKG